MQTLMDELVNHVEREVLSPTVRHVCQNVKQWRTAKMARHWTAAGMLEAAKGLSRLKANKRWPMIKAALAAHQVNGATKQKF
jgi:putative transposase